MAYKFTSEHRLKLRLAHLGKKPRLGKKLSPESRLKISLALKGKSNPKVSQLARKRVGMLGHNWKGGRPKCYKCFKILPSYKPTRCQECYLNSALGVNSPNWKGGINGNIARRTRKMSAEGAHTLQEWEELKIKYNFMCLCCKQQEPFIKLTEDHIVPLSLGGSNYISNIQPLCRSCNSRKHIQDIDYKKLWQITTS